jgi:hypothetical protein
MRIDDKVPGFLPIDLPRRLLAKRLSPLTSEGQLRFWRCAGRRRSDRRLDCEVPGDDLKAGDIAPYFFDLDYPFNGFVVAGARTSSDSGDGRSKCYRWRPHSTVPRHFSEEIVSDGQIDPLKRWLRPAVGVVHRGGHGTGREN